MDEELACLLREIRNLSKSIVSYSARFTANYRMQLMPFTVKGTMCFLSPDRHRSETAVQGRDIISIRKGAEVYRVITKRKEIWKFDLKGLLLADPVNFGVSDLRNPFFAVDEESLQYEGTVKKESDSAHTFSARIKSPLGETGHLDTRKGYTIEYKPKGPPLRIQLRIDSETGILLGMIGTTGSGEEVFQSEYLVEEVNMPLNESLFELDESTASYKTINMSEVFAASMNPDAADAPPSVN